MTGELIIEVGFGRKFAGILKEPEYLWVSAPAYEFPDFNRILSFDVPEF